MMNSVFAPVEFEIGGLVVRTWPPAEFADVTPQACSAAQGERALFDLRGIKSEHVLAAITQITDPDQQYRAHSAYTRATEWRRDSETTQTLAAILGLTESDMDELFTYAVTVNI